MARELLRSLLGGVALCSQLSGKRLFPTFTARVMTTIMHLYMLIFVGAGLGGTLRHAVQQLASHQLGESLPYGTFIVNLLGCFLMGALFTLLSSRAELSEPWRPLLATGFLGGFTTFSAFSQDVVLLYERGLPAEAMAYAIASVVFSTLLFLAGAALVRG